MSYQGKVYREQGGDKMVVAAGGTLELVGAVTGAIPGTAYFVDSVNGSGSNDGKSWSKAKATLAQAMALASADDVIFLASHHAETITAAAGGVISVAGVSVVGVGRGRQRPTFTFTTADAASFDVTAARVLLANCVFVNGRDGQTAMLNVSAADVTVLDCEFQLGDASTQAALGVLTTAAANRLRIQGCHFHGTADAGVTGAIRIVGGDSVVIQGNLIVGAFATTGAVENVTTATTNVVIDGNVILNQTADGNNKTIVLHGSATGIISNNRGGIIDSTSPAPVTAAAAWVAGNYWSSAVGVAASTLM